MGVARLKADRLVVRKARRELVLLRNGAVLKTCRIALGRHPEGAKARQGDGRTPEGDYVISGRNPASRYHLSLRISYPGPEDRARAAREECDPGGDIMIHGLPTEPGRLVSGDWTEGCIAVSNAEMEEIWELVPDGTPIRIEP